MASGLRDVVVGRRGWSDLEEPPQDRGKDPRAEIGRERVAQDRPAVLRPDLDRLDGLGTTALRDDGLPCRAQVADPVDLAEWRLHEPAAIELDDRDRECPRHPGGATADGE